MQLFGQLLLAYGICFGMQNKVPFLWKRSKFTDTLLSCTYCSGFHAGWMSWLITFLLSPAPFHFSLVGEMFAFALMSAVFCYGVDTVVNYLERNTPAE